MKEYCHCTKVCKRFILIGQGLNYDLRSGVDRAVTLNQDLPKLFSGK